MELDIIGVWDVFGLIKKFYMWVMGVDKYLILLVCGWLYCYEGFKVVSWFWDNWFWYWWWYFWVICGYVGLVWFGVLFVLGW